MSGGPDLVSIVMPSYTFEDFKPAFERKFPGLRLYRMPPEAEQPGEHVYGITSREES